MAFSAQITADISSFERNLAKAGGDIEKFSSKVANQLDKVGDSFIKIGTKASIFSAALVAVGTKAFLMAADIEDAVGATEQIFKENANSVNSWAGNLDTSFGIAKKEALEYSNLMGSMLINIGKLTTEQASKQSAKLIELAGDLTAMYGGSTQDAVRALTGALKGNNTMLDNYGMAVNEALIKQKALELGLMDTSGEMTLQAKQGATLALIWEQTGAAQGQAAREADGASGSMRALKTEITNLTTELGDVLLPIITPIVSGLKSFVSGIRDLSPEAKKVIVVVAGIAAAIGPLLLGLGGIIKILPLIGAGFTAITGPIGIAVAAIAGIAILVVKNWDKISAYFSTGGGAEMFTEIKRLATNLYEFVKGIFTAIKDIVVKLWERMGDTIIRVFGRVADIIGSVITVILRYINDLTDIFTADSLKGALLAFKNLFVNSFNGILDIVKKTLATMTDYIGSFFRLIGASKVADTMQRWAEALAPVIKHTEKLTKEQKESNKATEEGAKATDALASSLDKLTKKEIIPAGSLNALAAELKVLYDELNNATTESARLKIAELIKVVEIQIARISASVDRRKSEIGRDVGPKLQKIDSSAVTDKDIWNVDNEALKDKANATLSAIKPLISNVKTELAPEIASLDNMLSQGFVNIFATLGEALVSGDDILGSLGKMLVGTIGEMAMQIGAMMIGFGAMAQSLWTLIASPIGGAVAVIAGAALIALGAAAKAAVGGTMKKSLGGSGGSSAGAGGGITPAVNFPRGEFQLAGAYSEEVEFRISGDSLVGILSKKENKANRLN